MLDMLSGEEAEAEGDGEGSYSSRMSNKSEKNMADFDGEDSACEDEIAQLAVCTTFSIIVKTLINKFELIFSLFIVIDACVNAQYCFSSAIARKVPNAFGSPIICMFQGRQCLSTGKHSFMGFTSR